MEPRLTSAAVRTVGNRPAGLSISSMPKKGEETYSPQSTASGDDLRDISHKETPAIVETLLPLFAKIDLNNDGVLSPDELAIAIPVLEEYANGIGRVVIKYLGNAELTNRGSVTREDWRRYVESMGEAEFPEWLMKALSGLVSSLDLRGRKAAGGSSESSAPASKPKRRPWSRELADKKSTMVDVLLVLFEKMDVDSDGILSKDELAAATPHLRGHPDGSGQVLLTYLVNADSSKTGSVNQDDWERYVTCMAGFPFPDDLLRRIATVINDLGKALAASAMNAEKPNVPVSAVTQSSSKGGYPSPAANACAVPLEPAASAGTNTQTLLSQAAAAAPSKNGLTWSPEFDKARTPLTDLFVRLFESIDQDKDGVLSADELAVAIPLLSRQSNSGGQALVHYLEQAGLQKRGFITQQDWERYVGLLRSLTLPAELLQSFSSAIVSLHEACAAAAKPATVARSADELPGESVVASEPAREFEGAAVAASEGLATAEIRLESSGSFDPTQAPSRAHLLECLGISSDATIKALEGFAGGLNEGVWFLSEPSSGKDLVLKLVKCQRRSESVPTDAENLLRLSQQFPGIADDSQLAFPLMIISVLGENDEKMYDFIIMQKASGQSLAELIAIKQAFNQLDQLHMIMGRLGDCLYRFHSRYGDLQHGDFQPSNIFYDEKREKFTLIDVGGMGVPTADSDIAHFRNSMSLCFAAQGPEFTTSCLDRLQQGYDSAKGAAAAPSS